MNPEDLPLRDLHLPPPVGWWPPAPGWWLLAALVAAGLLWLAWNTYRRWERGRPRRVALAELKSLEARHAKDRDALDLVQGVSKLLRRTMLAYAPRQDIARLTGDAWLRWLDRGLPEPLFADGPAHSLASLPYRKPDRAALEPELPALLAAVRLRLATPLPEESS